MSEVVIQESDYGPNGLIASQVFAANHQYSGVVIYQRKSGLTERYAVDYATQIVCKRLHGEEEPVIDTPVMIEEPKPKTYAELHAECGLKVGDMVRITRIAASYENGWGDTWSRFMDKFVGTVGPISQDNGEEGFNIERAGNWNYPYFVLEKVGVEPEPQPAPSVPELVLPPGYGFVREGVVQEGDLINSMSNAPYQNNEPIGWIAVKPHNIGKPVSLYYDQEPLMAVCRPIAKPEPVEHITVITSDAELTSKPPEDYDGPPLPSGWLFVRKGVTVDYDQGFGVNFSPNKFSGYLVMGRNINNYRTSAGTVVIRQCEVVRG